jgi:hypothetical protein
MTALLAPCRKHSAASGGLHARTESVRLGAPASARLIGALWQSNPPYILRTATAEVSPQLRKPPQRPSKNQLVYATQTHRVKKGGGIADTDGKKGNTHARSAGSKIRRAVKLRCA